MEAVYEQGQPVPLVDDERGEAQQEQEVVLVGHSYLVPTERRC